MLKAASAGKGYATHIQKLKTAAHEQGWQADSSSGGTVLCLRESQRPFDEQEDYTVGSFLEFFAIRASMPKRQGFLL